ncbi:hypothetical protein L1887_63377 [Cichorium endivia]|nr:hypothetical protein L1887_63377 [Cichorium endivia]
MDPETRPTNTFRPVRGSKKARRGSRIRQAARRGDVHGQKAVPQRQTRHANGAARKVEKCDLTKGAAKVTAGKRCRFPCKAGQTTTGRRMASPAGCESPRAPASHIAHRTLQRLASSTSNDTIHGTSPAAHTRVAADTGSPRARRKRA